MDTHAEKGKLLLSKNGQAVFLAQESKMVPGAVDVIRFEGIIEHPSPTQAMAMAKKRGVSTADFHTSFGHLLPATTPNARRR